MNSKYLFIDTSLGRSSICYFNLQDDVLIYELSDKVMNQVEDLPLLYKILVSKVGDITIDNIFVCLGPGSYTGVRTGIAFAKGLCQNNVNKIKGISIFDAFKDQNSEDFVIKAGRDKFFEEGEKGLVRVTLNNTGRKIISEFNALDMYKFFINNKNPRVIDNLNQIFPK